MPSAARIGARGCASMGRQGRRGLEAHTWKAHGEEGAVSRQILPSWYNLPTSMERQSFGR